MQEEYNYWKIEYISFEGNERWSIARSPIDWEECDIRDNIDLGGCGDDVAEIRDIFETSNCDYSWDFINE